MLHQNEDDKKDEMQWRVNGKYVKPVQDKGIQLLFFFSYSKTQNAKMIHIKTIQFRY